MVTAMVSNSVVNSAVETTLLNKEIIVRFLFVGFTTRIDIGDTLIGIQESFLLQFTKKKLVSYS